MKLWALSKSSRTVIRGIEIGKDVMCEFKLKKRSRNGNSCNLKGVYSGTGSVFKQPAVCKQRLLLTHSLPAI